MVKLDVDSLDKFRQIVSDFRDQHEGYGNAYETLFLAAGADATVVGSDLSQIDFKTVQGGGETRIAAAAGVHPGHRGAVGGIAGLEPERRQLPVRPPSHRRPDAAPVVAERVRLALQIVMVPSDAELWYDDRDIAFLQEDQKDAAEILQVDATSAVALVNESFAPESVIEAVGAETCRCWFTRVCCRCSLQESDRETPEPPAAPTAVVPPKRAGSDGHARGRTDANAEGTRPAEADQRQRRLTRRACSPGLRHRRTHPRHGGAATVGGRRDPGTQPRRRRPSTRRERHRRTSPGHS